LWVLTPCILASKRKDVAENEVDSYEILVRLYKITGRLIPENSNMLPEDTAFTDSPNAG
jgi:hypothetical protein